MIQRIQSIFLFLSSAGSLSLFQFPFASTNEGVAQSEIFADSTYNIMDHVGLIAIFALAGVMAFAAIFLFKNRPLQANLGRVALVANIIGIILAVVLFMQDGVILMEKMAVNDGVGAYLPFVAILFAGLGVYYVRKDDKLVRSMDRLR